MSIAVVYYSKYNNTRTGAEFISERVGGKIIELIEAKKGNFLQAILKKSSKLKGDPWSEMKDSSTIYLMLPIWASNGVPAMNAFLDKADFTEKKVRIITFQMFEDLKNSDKVHNHIAASVKARGGSVVDSFAFLGGKMGKFLGTEQIEAQLCTIFYDGCCED